MSDSEFKNIKLELHIIVWGRVQGVGFRMAARHYALKYNLVGSVRNLEDGNVEIFAQGSRQELENFIQDIKDHFNHGYIARLDTKYSKPSHAFHQFVILT